MLHKPIINKEVWQKSRDILGSNKGKIQLPTSRVTKAPLLKGIMNCGICGSKMTPTYTTKKNKRYRYYICQKKLKGNCDDCPIGRIPASETEELVTDQVLSLLKKPEFIIHTINAKSDDLTENKIINYFKSIDKIWDELFPVEQVRIMNLLVKNIDIKPEGLNIKIFKEGLHSLSTELIN